MALACLWRRGQEKWILSTGERLKSPRRGRSSGPSATRSTLMPVVVSPVAFRMSSGPRGPTRGPRLLKWPRVSSDLVATGPQDPKLLMVLEDGPRVEFWVVSTDGEISSGRVVEEP